MKNYRQASNTDLVPFSSIKGLPRVQNRIGEMSLKFHIAFQTKVAASRFRASFYDLSLKMRGAKTKGDEEVRRAALSAFSLGLDEIRREHGLESHDAMVRDLQPFDNPPCSYWVDAIDRGCPALFDGYYQLDTFVMAVTHARDTSLITGEQAKALIFRADGLFENLKKGYSSLRTSTRK